MPPARPLLALALTTLVAATAACGGDDGSSTATASTPAPTTPTTAPAPASAPSTGASQRDGVPAALCRIVARHTDALIDDLRPVSVRGATRPEAAKACFFGRPGIARDDALVTFDAYTEASVGSSLEDFRDENEWGHSEVTVEQVQNLGDDGARIAHVGMIPGRASTQVSWTQDERWFTLTYSGKTLDGGTATPLERVARRIAKDL